MRVYSLFSSFKDNHYGFTSAIIVVMFVVLGVLSIAQFSLLLLAGGFGIFLLCQYIRQIHHDAYEAAKLDGCDRFRYL